MNRAGAFSAHEQAMRALYSPTSSEICAQLPVIGASVADAFAALSAAPNPARAAQVAAQLNGALALVGKLREALLRESAEPTA